MKKYSIKNRLFTIMLLTSTITLLVTGVLFIFFQGAKLKQELRGNLALHTNVIADNVQATIVFEDSHEAEHSLASLKYDQQIVEAFLLNINRRVIGHYQLKGLAVLDENLPLDALGPEDVFFRDTGSYAIYAKPVVSGGNKIGYVILYADYSRYWEMLTSFTAVVVVVLFFGFFIALFLSLILQRVISQPIESLAEFVSKVTADENYTLRIENKSYLEIDQFGRSFNSLLNQIGNVIAARDQAQEKLKEHSLNLQQLVYDRTRELELAKEEAEAASRAKSAFLANISHEIRTPMNAIVGFTRLALNDATMPHQKNQLNHVLNSADLLLRLIDDLLDVSRIEAGKMELDYTHCDLYALIEEINQMLIARIAEKKLEFIIDVADTVPRYVVVDSLRLKQILINLLTNAIKFTPSGQIWLRLTAIETRRAKQVEIFFSVQDSGVGMDAGTLTRVFDVFVQGDVSTTRQYGGTGLGLSISKKLLELMNSRLDIESEPGKGSQFTFSLPLEYMLMDERELKDASGAGQLSVMVVEPQKYSREHLLKLLRKAGCWATAVSQGDIALNRLSEIRIEQIYISLELEDMDGFTLAERIRNDPQLTDLTIVIMANSLAEQQVRAFISRYHSMAFLPKPVYDSEQLRIVLSGERKREEIPVETGVPKISNEKWFDKVLIVDDFEINRILVMDILQNEVGRFLEAENGREAVELLKKESIDLILMDVQMPVMDGYQACREIRQGLKMTEIPIVGMTAYAADNESQLCYQSGMNEVLTKPIELEKFNGVLRTLCNQPVRFHQDKDETRPVPELLLGISLPGLDVAKGLKNLQNDEEKYRSLLVLYYKTYRNKFTELEQLIQDQQWSQAANWVHALKGVCANLYISSLADSCRRVEDQFRQQKTDEARMAEFKLHYHEILNILTRLMD